MSTLLIIFFATLSLVVLINWLFAKDDFRMQKEINQIYLKHKTLSDAKLSELHEENDKLRKLNEELKTELQLLTKEQINQ